MNPKELREQTNEEAVELACQLRARTLNYPNSEELHNAAVASKAEVVRRLIEKEKEVEKLHNEYRTMLTEQGSDFKKTIAELNGELKMVTLERDGMSRSNHTYQTELASLRSELAKQKAEVEKWRECASNFKKYLDEEAL